MYFFYNVDIFEKGFKLITGGFIYILICFLILYGLYYYSLWKIFSKCGYKGWEALIPFYRNYILINLSGLNWWWFLLSLAYPLVDILDMWEMLFIGKIITLFSICNIFYNIAKKYGYNDNNSLLLAIFSPILVIVNGTTDNNKYNKDAFVYKNGLFDLFYYGYNIDKGKSTNTFNEKMKENNNIDNEKEKMNNINIKDNIKNHKSSNNNIRYCINCGNELSENMNFCPRCGTKKN